jgi:hypothetical protein
MEEWSKQTIALLDEKTKNVKQRDIRFYRVQEFKRNIERVGEFSKSCPYCEKEKIGIAAIVGKMDEAIEVPGKTRREYDRAISRLSGHMQKNHGFFTPYYFTYLFSFFGMVAGILAGYIFMRLFPAYDWILLPAGFVAGLMTGYFWGHAKDKKIRHSKKLM